MSYAIAQQKIAQAQAEGWTELDLAGLELEELSPELRSCFRVIESGQLTGETMTLDRYDLVK